MRFIVDTGVFATEDTAHRQRFNVVRDHQRISIQFCFAAVEQNQGFALFRHTHHNTAFDTIFIERVHRLTQLQQNIVGHVNDGVDRTNTTATQLLFHPQRGWRFYVNAFHHTTKVAWARISGFNLNRQCVTDGSVNRYDFRCVQFSLVQHGHIAGHADNA